MQFGQLKRREFIRLLGGAAAAAVAARAQEADRVRRIGCLYSFAENDPERQVRVQVFEQALQRLGWIVGRNLLIDYRWTGFNPNRIRPFARELVELSPDVL